MPVASKPVPTAKNNQSGLHAAALNSSNLVHHAIVFAVWASVSLFALVHHEKWADEAQSWLLARDLDLWTLWFKELHYEGTPGLWHTTLWFAQHVLRIPYTAIGVLGWVCAAAGIWFLFVRSPFPRPVRWAMAFSCAFLYQYAVIARPYVLLQILAFAACDAFKDEDRPVRMTIVLALLAGLSAHGTLMAGCIGIAYLAQGSVDWRGLLPNTRVNYIICSAAMVLLMLFLYMTMKPAPDSIGMAEVQSKSAGLIGWRLLDGVDSALFEFKPVTVAWLVVLVAWCVLRRGAHSYVVPLGMFAMAGMYAFYGRPHHIQTIFTAVVAGLWIAWPSDAEVRGLSETARKLHYGFVGTLVILLTYQAFVGIVAVKHEYESPYSGAPAAAAYIKRVGGEHPRVMGLGFLSGAVNAYFDQNIEVHRNGYFHNSVRAEQYEYEAAKQLDVLKPDFVVVPCFANECESLTAGAKEFIGLGYTLVQFSDGYLLDRRGWFVHDAYFVFQRDGFTALSR